MHLITTRGWFTRAVYGTQNGSPFERKVYVAISVTTWWIVVAYHEPVPGFLIEMPAIAGFLSCVGFIPLEERQLIEARAEAYKEYTNMTRWWVIKGLW